MQEIMMSNGSKDLVKCMNCNFSGEVKATEEQCPNCKKIGCLAWLDEC